MWHRDLAFDFGDRRCRDTDERSRSPQHRFHLLGKSLSRLLPRLRGIHIAILHAIIAQAQPLSVN